MPANVTGERPLQSLQWNGLLKKSPGELSGSTGTYEPLTRDFLAITCVMCVWRRNVESYFVCSHDGPSDRRAEACC